MKLTPDIHLMKCLWHICFEVETVLIKVTYVVPNFCCVSSLASAFLAEFHIWQIKLMRGACVLHHFQVKGQGHTDRLKFLPCLFRNSVPIWLIHFICGTKSQLQPMWGWCVMHHFEVNSHRSRSHSVFKVFAMSAPWLCAYSTDLLHMWDEYNP